MKSAAGFLAVSLAACAPGLDLADNVQIYCQTDADCPDGFLCLIEIERCERAARPDQAGPTLDSVVPVSEVQLDLGFSEPIAPAAASLPASYAITPALHVVMAALTGEQTVSLIVDEQVPGQEYTLTAGGIADVSGNLIQADGAARTFIGFGVVPDQSPPLMLSPPENAVIEGSTVLLVWSARMAANAFFVEVATDSSFANQIAPSPVQVSSDTTSLTVNGLPADATIYWRVRADTTAPASGSTDPWSAVTAHSFQTLGTELHVFCPAGALCDPPPASPTLAQVESGNLVTPFRSIQRALNAATQYGLSSIRIANRDALGTPYLEGLVIPAGVSLHGGYDPTFTSMDLQHPTVIEATGAVANVSNATPGYDTLLENLHLRGSPSALQTSSTALSITDSDDGIEVRNCILEGGPATDRSVGVWLLRGRGEFDHVPYLHDDDIRGGVATESIGAFVERGGVFLEHNTLSAVGDAEGRAIAVAAVDATYGRLYQNSITATSPNTSYGVHWDYPPMGDTVLDNSIGYLSIEQNEVHVDPEASTGKEGMGIFYRTRFRRDPVPDPARMRVEVLNNYVTCTPAMVTSELFLQSTTVPVVVANNLIVSPASAYGQHLVVRLQGSQQVLLSHNLLAAGPNPSGPTFVAFIRQGLSASEGEILGATPTFVSNIMVSFPSSDAYTLFERDEESDSAALLNNLIIPGSGTLVYDEWATVVSDPATVNHEAVCCGGRFSVNACPPATTQQSNIANNWVAALSPASVFVDYDGPDNDLNTWADNDWHLLTTDNRITNGGHNPLATDCGTFGNCPAASSCGTCTCGGVTTDRDGRSRDATPAMGPYEP